MYTELWEGETGFEAQQVLCGESAPGKSGGNEVIMVIMVSQCDSGKSGGSGKSGQLFRIAVVNQDDQWQFVGIVVSQGDRGKLG